MNSISVKSAVDGLVSYLSNEAVKIPDLKSRFLMFAALGSAKVNPEPLLTGLRPTLEMVGILHGDDVNLDAVREALASGFANVPTFKALGFTFTEKDIPVLLRHLAKFGGTEDA